MNEGEIIYTLTQVSPNRMFAFSCFLSRQIYSTN